MNKKPLLLVIILATILFLLFVTTAASSGSSSGYSRMFCPACWTFLSGPASVDMKGNCAQCGRYPVELEVATQAWFWCSRQMKWLEMPCPESPRLGCCSREESFAVLVTPGSPMIHAWYCPWDERFASMPLPLLAERVCPTCGRPTVKVTAVSRSYYWCSLEEVWNPEPCPMNPIKKCCSKYEGLILVHPDPGPLARPSTTHRQEPQRDTKTP